jgi:hypothetical protein
LPEFEREQEEETAAPNWCPSLITVKIVDSFLAPLKIVFRGTFPKIGRRSSKRNNGPTHGVWFDFGERAAKYDFGGRSLKSIITLKIMTRRAHVQTIFGHFLLTSSATARYHGLPVIIRHAGRRVCANYFWVSEFSAPAAAYSLRNPDSRVVLQLFNHAEPAGSSQNHVTSPVIFLPARKHVTCRGTRQIVRHDMLTIDHSKITALSSGPHSF